MKLNIPFGIGQTVYFIWGQEVKSDTIRCIDITIRSVRDISVEYYLTNYKPWENGEIKYFYEKKLIC